MVPKCPEALLERITQSALSPGGAFSTVELSRRAKELKTVSGGTSKAKAANKKLDGGSPAPSDDSYSADSIFGESGSDVDGSQPAKPPSGSTKTRIGMAAGGIRGSPRICSPVHRAGLTTCLPATFRFKTSAKRPRLTPCSN